MKQGKSKKRSRIDGPLSERNESDHDEIVIRSNRRQRSTRFVRESNSSNPTPSTSALDAVPSSSSGGYFKTLLSCFHDFLGFSKSTSVSAMVSARYVMYLLYGHIISAYIILGRSSGGGVYFWKISGGVPNF